MKAFVVFHPLECTILAEVLLSGILPQNHCRRVCPLSVMLELPAPCTTAVWSQFACILLGHHMGLATMHHKVPHSPRRQTANPKGGGRVSPIHLLQPHSGIPHTPGTTAALAILGTGPPDGTMHPPVQPLHVLHPSPKAPTQICTNSRTCGSCTTMQNSRICGSFALHAPRICLKQLRLCGAHGPAMQCDRPSECQTVLQSPPRVSASHGNATNSPFWVGGHVHTVGCDAQPPPPPGSCVHLAICV